MSIQRTFENPSVKEEDSTAPTIQVRRERRLPDDAEYVVGFAYPGGVRKVIWNAKSPIAIDHPVRHVLVQRDGVLSVRDSRSGELVYRVPSSYVEEGTAFEINGVTVQLCPVNRPRAAYLSSGVKPGRPISLYVVHGIGERVEGFGMVEQYGFLGSVEGRELFSATMTGGAISLVPKSAELGLEEEGLQRQLPLGGAIAMDLSTLDQKVLRAGQYWWRFQLVGETPVDEMLLPDAEEDSESRTFKWVAQALSAVMVLSWLFVDPKVEVREEAVTPEPPKPTIVRLRRPAPPKPAPKVEKKIAKVVKPKPKQAPKAKKQAPKMARKPAPKQIRKAAPAKLARKKPVARKPIRTAAAPVKRPKAAPVQRPIARRPVVSKPAVSPAIVQARQARKQAQAKVAQSLSFLSGASSKLAKAPAGFANRPNPEARYQQLSAASAAVAGKSNLSYVSAVAGSAGRGAEFANTRGARSISSDAGVVGGYGAGGRGKALNDVQGRVTLAALYNPDGGSGLGSSLGGNGGLTLSGAGRISEAALMKLLQKYLQKFQYCYEKALLSNPALAGSLLMQWQILPGGSGRGIQVVRSQLNNSGLHECVSNQLANIRFPSPQGGSVTVKYPFSFSSTTL